MNMEDNKFLFLVQRDSFPGMLSASSAALDLASLAQIPPCHSNLLRPTTMPCENEWSPFDSPMGLKNQTHPRAKAIGAPPSIPPIILTSPKQDKNGSSLLPPSSSSRLNPVIGKGYSGRDFSILRPPLSTSSKTINGSGPGLSLYQLGEGASLEARFGPYNSGNISASAASNLGFGFDGPDGYDLALGSNDANAQNLIGIIARHNPETKRFANICLEDMQGDIFGLCKDQHGCCFLQRKLEEGDPAQQDMIFAEIYPHFGELMTALRCLSTSPRPDNFFFIFDFPTSCVVCSAKSNTQINTVCMRLRGYFHWVKETAWPGVMSNFLANYTSLLQLKESCVMFNLLPN
ncbi:hypothetical protein BY996DRAFT_6412767 [Phakopsora pachyrhizi]|nr:hypothetical protein BY996DRAFT_6412767 [Phakopsora pachyrhizi]